MGVQSILGEGKWVPQQIRGFQIDYECGLLDGLKIQKKITNFSRFYQIVIQQFSYYFSSIEDTPDETHCFNAVCIMTKRCARPFDKIGRKRHVQKIPSFAGRYKNLGARKS
jgi:hypothetical protein